MSSLRTNADLQKYLNGRDPSAQRNRPFTHVADFNANITANGGNATVNTLVGNDYNFIVRSVKVSFWIAAASGTAIIGTPLADGSNPTTGQNDFTQYAHLSMQVRTDTDLFERPIRLNTIGDGSSYQLFLEDPWVFAAGSAVATTITNNAPAGQPVIQGQVQFWGYRIYQN